MGQISRRENGRRDPDMIHVLRRPRVSLGAPKEDGGDSGMRARDPRNAIAVLY